MRSIIKIYSKKDNKHTNTMMLCGTGTGNWDAHDTYQWVSYPWGTIYPEVFQSKEEALKFFDNNEHVYYEEMKNCSMEVLDKDGNWTNAWAEKNKR